MFNRLEIGRIGGIPIYLDMMFVLVLLFFTYPYFIGGDAQDASAGFVILVGILLSLLLHELGHAFAGRPFRAHVSHIDLTGLGGITHFERSLPRSVLARTIIYLAGPAVNLALWFGFTELSRQAAFAGAWTLAKPLFVLAWINQVLTIFNLLPAYPLDGGLALDAWLGRLLGPLWSVRIIAALGLVCSAWLAYMALPTNFYLLFIALFLAMANWEKLQGLGRWQW
jgi:Zn-dependent protease